MRLGKHGWTIKGSYKNFDKAEKSERGQSGNLQINSNNPYGFFDSATNKNKPITWVKRQPSDL